LRILPVNVLFACGKSGAAAMPRRHAPEIGGVFTAHPTQGDPEIPAEWTRKAIDQLNADAMCGMQFQEVSQAYYCISCGRLSDFSDQTPDFDAEKEHSAWLADNPSPATTGMNQFAVLSSAPYYAG
jgi:hypothetical protein